MTIMNQDALATYVGDGIASEFPFGFLIPEDAIAVSVVVAAEITELPSGDFTVSGFDNPEGGTVTYAPGGTPTPVPSGWVFVIERRVPFTQETSIENQQRFYADVVERTFDRLVMQIQQLHEQSKLAVQVPPGETPVNYLGVLTALETQAQEAKNTAVTAAENAGASEAASAGWAETAEVIAELLGEWRGAWATTTQYNISDGVRFEGSSYICLISHTASASFLADLESDPPKWDLFAQRGASGDGIGDMTAAVYDPTGVEANVYARANHTGTQAAGTITGLATVATSGSYPDLTNRPPQIADPTNAAAEVPSLWSGANVAAAADARVTTEKVGEAAASVEAFAIGSVALASESTSGTFNANTTVAGSALRELRPYVRSTGSVPFDEQDLRGTSGAALPGTWRRLHPTGRSSRIGWGLYLRIS
jgi:hypothetical protein